jgi:hypothetical protein
VRTTTRPAGRDSTRRRFPDQGRPCDEGRVHAKAFAARSIGPSRAFRANTEAIRGGVRPERSPTSGPLQPEHSPSMTSIKSTAGVGRLDSARPQRRRSRGDRGAVELCGDERAPPPARRSERVEAWGQSGCLGRPPFGTANPMNQPAAHLERTRPVRTTTSLHGGEEDVTTVADGLSQGRLCPSGTLR